MDGPEQVNDATGWTRSEPRIRAFRDALLDWYDRQGRALPWRIRPEDREAGREPDAYRVWLSEVMLQQTTVAHGTRYWEAFVEAFPTVCDLARADGDRVMGMWAGLGYYARARNLHACAKRVCEEMDGVFPTDEATLLTLPGIGPYSAAAIAAICAGAPTNVVDGNVERVMSRLFAVQAPLPKARRELRRLAGRLVRETRAEDYPQALMDLGATVCRPRNPACLVCPVAEFCAARAAGEAGSYPRKAARAAVPTRHGQAFVIVRDGEVWLERRAATGLLGGMLGFPTTEWSDAAPDAPGGAWEPAGTARHTFSHFHLELDVFVAGAEAEGKPEGLPGGWRPVASVAELPTLMRKVWERAAAHLEARDNA